jgi:hypothetical protein
MNTNVVATLTEKDAKYAYLLVNGYVIHTYFVADDQSQEEAELLGQDLADALPGGIFLKLKIDAVSNLRISNTRKIGILTIGDLYDYALALWEMARIIRKYPWLKENSGE